MASNYKHAGQRVILLTGATGYVGGQLLCRLEKLPVQLRCLARKPEKLRPHVAANTEIVAGDVVDRVIQVDVDVVGKPTRNDVKLSQRPAPAAIVLGHAINAGKLVEPIKYSSLLDDDADSEVDDISAKHEFLEFLKHDMLFLCPREDQRNKS